MKKKASDKKADAFFMDFLTGKRVFVTVKRKFIWITAFIIVAAVIIVLCVSYFTGGKTSEFDGTLVNLNFEFPCLL